MVQTQHNKMPTYQQGELNISLLRAAVKDVPKFALVMDYFYGRDRGRGSVAIERTRRSIVDTKKCDLSTEDLIPVFETLQKAGAGVIGQGKNKARFIWVLHLQAVAAAALNRPIPQRYKRDGTPIVEPGIRKATPPRPVPLPKHVTPISPVIVQENTPAPTRHLRSTPQLVQNTVPGNLTMVAEQDGIAIYIDATKLTPESTRKFADILALLRKS